MVIIKGNSKGLVGVFFSGLSVVPFLTHVIIFNNQETVLLSKNR